MDALSSNLQFDLPSVKLVATITIINTVLDLQLLKLLIVIFDLHTKKLFKIN